MKQQAVTVGSDLFEQVQYAEHALPVHFCVDSFDQLLNNEINYHWHEEFEFAVMLQGEVEYVLHQGDMGPVVCRMQAGDGVFVNARTLHTARQLTPGAVMSCFLFPAHLLSGRLTGQIYTACVQPVIRSASPGLFFSAQEAKHAEILQTMRQFLALDPNADTYALAGMEALYRLWRLLLCAYQGNSTPAETRTENRQEQRTRMMLAYIHTHYAENITVSDIAAAANVSKSECFRCFRDIIQKTPVEYLLEHRLSQAAAMLTDTERTVVEICLRCGMPNASYFGKIFKERYGMTPRQYRTQRELGT